MTSEVGSGSSFTFTFCADPADMEPGPPPDISALIDRRLLIVDDNETSRRVLRMHATAWGMRPSTSISGHEALGVLGIDGGLPPFDVVLLDGSMTERDGFDLVQAIRRHHDAAALPIVVLTPFGETAARRLADQHGSAAFVAKPVKKSVLRDALTSALSGGARRAREPAHSLFDRDLARRHPLRILVAEDNRINQRLVVQMLQRLGYRPDVAANGIEVVAALERQPYDVILMDVQMPELDGLEAARAIRQRSRQSPQPRIIAMTAGAMREDREACVAAGMEDHLAKPFSVLDLTGALRRASAAGHSRGVW